MDTECLVAEHEAYFAILDEIRRHLPDVPADEVERDVAEAVAAVRASNALCPVAQDGILHYSVACDPISARRTARTMRK